MMQREANQDKVEEKVPRGFEIKPRTGRILRRSKGS